MHIFPPKVRVEDTGYLAGVRLGGLTGVSFSKRGLGVLMTREVQDPIRQADSHMGTVSSLKVIPQKDFGVSSFILPVIVDQPSSTCLKVPGCQVQLLGCILHICWPCRFGKPET